MFPNIHDKCTAIITKIIQPYGPLGDEARKQKRMNENSIWQI
jgi:hypothetical protein